MTEAYPCRDELETAAGLKTLTCFHLSMVHITVVTQSNWTHPESHTRTESAINSGQERQIVPETDPNSLYSYLFIPEEPNLMVIKRCFTTLLWTEDVHIYVRKLSRFLLQNKIISAWIAIQSHEHATLYEQLWNSLPSACCLTEASASEHNISRLLWGYTTLLTTQ